MPGEEKQTSMLERIGQSVAIGIPRVVLTFGAGQPIDLLKTRMQANPVYTSAIALSKEIFQKEGVRGFYAGGLSSFNRSLLKEAYRTPLRGFLTSYFDKKLPNMNVATRSSLTSLSMALTDVVLTTPFDRIKVWRMTHENKPKGMLEFFYNRTPDQPHVLKDLYKGSAISLFRGGVSWGSYLIPNALLKENVEKSKSDSKDAQSGFVRKFFIGSLSGFTNCIFTLPIDTVKTNIQKKSYQGSGSIKDIFRIGRNLVKEHGIAGGLYPAFTPKLFHYAVVGVLTEDVIDRVDKVWGVKNK